MTDAIELTHLGIECARLSTDKHLGLGALFLHSMGVVIHGVLQQLTPTGLELRGLVCCRNLTSLLILRRNVLLLSRRILHVKTCENPLCHLGEVRLAMRLYHLLLTSL